MSFGVFLLYPPYLTLLQLQRLQPQSRLQLLFDPWDLCPGYWYLLCYLLLEQVAEVLYQAFFWDGVVEFPKISRIRNGVPL